MHQNINQDDIITLPMFPIAPNVMPKEEETVAIIFCDKCGCNYINGCTKPEHK